MTCRSCEEYDGTTVCGDCGKKYDMVTFGTVTRLSEALRLVAYTNRSRGYPTPKEWDELVRVANEALKEPA